MQAGSLEPEDIHPTFAEARYRSAPLIGGGPRVTAKRGAFMTVPDSAPRRWELPGFSKSCSCSPRGGWLRR